MVQLVSVLYLLLSLFVTRCESYCIVPYTRCQYHHHHRCNHRKQSQCPNNVMMFHCCRPMNYNNNHIIETTQQFIHHGTTSTTQNSISPISVFYTTMILLSTLLLLPMNSNANIDDRSSTIQQQQQQVDIDKANIYTGYQQLNYLLDHWVDETTICGMSDNPYTSKNGCERSPIKIMDYLGYKNMNHPLFRADKTLRRLETYIPMNDEIQFYDAIEAYMIAAEEGNGMAYISSWGEANPGGGKDRVELFIDRAKKNVIQARDSLQVIIDILHIEAPI